MDIIKTLIVREATVQYKSKSKKNPAPDVLLGAKEVHALFVKTGLSSSIQEHFLVFALDNRNNCQGWMECARGGMSAAHIDVRVVFSFLLSVGATKFVVAHNHPSGNCFPSVEDVNVKDKLAKGGGLLGIELVDCLVCTQDNYQSMMY